MPGSATNGTARLSLADFPQSILIGHVPGFVCGPEAGIEVVVRLLDDDL